jgi:hypothetical protein
MTNWRNSDAHDRAFTVAAATLTPEMEATFRAWILAAIVGRWSVRRLKETVTQSQLPAPFLTIPLGGEK